jgi:hypothetical protein
VVYDIFKAECMDYSIWLSAFYFKDWHHFD